MRIDIDPVLAEGAVFGEIRAREAAGDARTAGRYFREIERTYRHPSGDARDEAAREVHSRWFSLLGLDRAVARAAVETGPALGRADRIVVRHAVSAKDEGAELFARPREGGDGEEFTVVLRLRAERFADGDAFARFLRHELRLAADLLDPAFGFHKEPLPDGGPTPANLVRDRYRLLWETSADGRIERSGRASLRPREAWAALFEKAFVFLPEESRRATFARLYDGPRPPHAELLRLARDPRAALAEAAGLPPGGSRCPLCRFPTYAWEPEAGDLAAKVLARIRASFPDWLPAQGVCRECADRYRVAVCA